MSSSINNSSSSELPEASDQETELSLEQEVDRICALSNQGWRDLIQSLPVLPQPTVEETGAVLVKTEAALDEYKAEVDAIEKFLATYLTASGTATRSEQSERVTSSISNIQLDVEHIGQVDEAVIEALRNAFKAQPLLLKAIDEDFARQTVKDVGDRVQVLGDRLQIAFSQIQYLEKTTFVDFAKRCATSFRHQLRHVIKAADEVQRKLQVNVRSLKTTCGELKKNNEKLLDEVAASEQQRDEDLAKACQEIISLKQSLVTKRMEIDRLTQNYESKSNILLREHGRLISGMAEKYKPMLEERLQLQKVRLEGEQDILNRLSARASDELRKELSDERGITELLRAQVQRLAASEKQLKEQLQTEKTNTGSLVQHIGELTLEKEALESQPEPEQSKTSTLQGEVPDLI